MSTVRRPGEGPRSNLLLICWPGPAAPVGAGIASAGNDGAGTAVSPEATTSLPVLRNEREAAARCGLAAVGGC